MKIKYASEEIAEISNNILLDLIFIKVKVNAETIMLIFDSGATRTTISRSTAKMINAEFLNKEIRGGGNNGKIIRGETAIIPEMAVGNTIIHGLDVTVFNDDSFKFDLGESGGVVTIAGLLGWDVISQFNWKFDINDHSLSFGIPKIEKNTNNIMEPWDNMPIIRIMFNEKNYFFGLDTGNTESTIGARMYSKFKGANEMGSSIMGIDGIGIESVRVVESFIISIGKTVVRIKDIEAINRELFPTSRDDINGLLGFDVIRGRSWRLDYKNKYFEVG